MRIEEPRRMNPKKDNLEARIEKFVINVISFDYIKVIFTGNY